MTMRTASLLLVLAALLGGCKKAPPPGRPADVCAGVKALADCAAMPDGSRAAGAVAAANCYDVGNQQFHCGLFEEAGRSFERSAELGNDPRAWHMLGEAHLLQEHWSSALEAYGKAVALDPRKRETWLRIGKVAAHLRHFEQAHQAYARAQALDPKRADAFDGDADVYAAELEFDEAVKRLRQAEGLGDAATKVACTGHEVRLLSLKLSRMKRSSGTTDEALADASAQLADALQRLTQLDGDEANLFRELADAELGAGELDKAEAALIRASELDPKDFVSPRLVAILRERRRDGAGARQEIEASLKIQPKQAMPYIVLGRLDAASGDMAAARRDFDHALAQEDGKDAAETRQLAELAERVGVLEKAEALDKALDDDPDESTRLDFWLERARISARLHHASEVKLACGRARGLDPKTACPPAAR